MTLSPADRELVDRLRAEQAEITGELDTLGQWMAAIEARGHFLEGERDLLAAAVESLQHRQRIAHALLIRRTAH